MQDKRRMPKPASSDSIRGIRINTKEEGRLLHHRKDILSFVIIKLSR